MGQRDKGIRGKMKESDKAERQLDQGLNQQEPDNQDGEFPIVFMMGLCP
jgi:hypothetical protein